MRKWREDSLIWQIRLQIELGSSGNSLNGRDKGDVFDLEEMFIQFYKEQERRY